MAKAGRPSKYNPEVAAKICERLSEGESLRKICKDSDLPDRCTVLKWLTIHPEFNHQYARARVISAEADADDVAFCAREVLEGRMDAAAANAAVNALKWSAGQRNPKRYGPNNTFDPDAPNQINKPTINVSLLSQEQRDFLRQILIDSNPQRLIGHNGE